MRFECVDWMKWFSAGFKGGVMWTQ